MTDPDAAIVRRMAWRLMPLLTLSYFVSIVDRSNIGVAALTMNGDLGLTATQYGLAAGIFAVPYMLFEVPSNLALLRFGARAWIARIMFTWGIVAGAQALIWDANSFYAARALLGAAEAGFVPGVLLYMTMWFPAAYRGRMISIFFLGIPVALIIATPISGFILGLDGLLGLRGWQWLYVIEAVPALALAVALPFILPRDLQSASFLTPAERLRLATRLEAEQVARERSHVIHSNLIVALLNPRVLLLCLAYYGIAGLNNGVVTFLPLVLKQYGVTNLQATFIAIIPYGFGALGMVVLGRFADRPGKRALANYLALAISMIGLVGSAYVQGQALQMVAICVAGFGVFAVMPVFWGIPTGILSGTAAAGGIALVNALAQFASFVNPLVIGAIRDRSGSFNGGLLWLAAMAAMSTVVLTIVFARWGRPERAVPNAATVGSSG